MQLLFIILWIIICDQYLPIQFGCWEINISNYSGWVSMVMMTEFVSLINKRLYYQYIFTYLPKLEVVVYNNVNNASISWFILVVEKSIFPTYLGRSKFDRWQIWNYKPKYFIYLSSLGNIKSFTNTFTTSIIFWTHFQFIFEGYVSFNLINQLSINLLPQNFHPFCNQWK